MSERERKRERERKPDEEGDGGRQKDRKTGRQGESKVRGAKQKRDSE